MSRRLASTPSVEKSQAETGVNAVTDASKTPEQSHDSPVAPEADHQQLSEESASHAAAGVKDEGEEREYSPPEAVPPVAAQSVQP